MGKIKIVSMLSVVISIINLIINIAMANNFFRSILNAIVTGILSFGVIYAVVFLLTDVFKIDFSIEDNAQSQADGESQVDMTVGDDDFIGDDASDHTTNDSGGDDAVFVGDNSESDESEEAFRADDGVSGSPYSGGDGGDESLSTTEWEGDSKASNPNVEKTISSMLGFDASPEEMARAIKTKLKREG